MESKNIPEAFIPGMEELIAEGAFSHEVATDKAAIAHAKTVLAQKGGYQGAKAYWDAMITSGKGLNKNDIALGQLLMAEAAQAGDAEATMTLLGDLCVEGAHAGRVVQAMRLLKKMTPEGQAYYLQRTVEKLNQDFEGRGVKIEIDPQLNLDLMNAKTPGQMEAAVEAIKDSVAAQVPVTWYDKWNAWRYLSMLGNTRTQIRNLFGNAVFTPVVKTKNLIALGLEKAAKSRGWLPEASKAFLNPANAGDKALLDFAKADFENVKGAVQGEGKYNQKNDILSRRRIFKTGVIEAARTATDRAMDVGDVIFSKRHYRDSLAQHLKANGITAEMLEQAKSLPDDQGASLNMALAQARNYAIKEAQKATFRDANYVASMLSHAKRSLANTANSRENSLGKRAAARGMEVLMEGLVPFTKTPANILVRGVEYSPAGLLKALTFDLYQVRQGRKTAADALDSIAAGLTGTTLTGLGLLFASLDWVTGAGEDDDRERDYNKMLGEQTYALNVGDYSYTIDWLAPAALPFFVGVSLYDLVKEGKFETAQILDALSVMGEPMLEMSMLQGVNSSFEAVRYSDQAALTSWGGNLALGYFGQGVPTLFGQVARAIDGTRRQTYYNPNYKGVVKEGGAFLQK